MEARAVIKYLRIGPRKVRPVLDLVRRKPAKKALGILSALNKKGARLALQALKSAMANAKIKKMNEDNLVISDIRADGGPILKRFMSRSMGRANRILKRTTHITVVLHEAIEAVTEKKEATGVATDDTGRTRNKAGRQKVSAAKAPRAKVTKKK